MVFLAPQFIEHAFHELRSIDGEGKRHLERTSGLMYFLALCAAIHNQGLHTLDLDPDTTQGKNLRQILELEFTRLVLLNNIGDGFRQVMALGAVHEGGTSPEKRISSNFLTVPVKKASVSMQPWGYPRRPAPLISLGATLTGKHWGAALHADWKANLPKFLTDSKSRAPFTHLAVFVARSCGDFRGTRELLREDLTDCLQKRFPGPLADFWGEKMRVERSYFSYEGEMFSKERLKQFSARATSSKQRLTALLSMNHKELAKHALALEESLAKQGRTGI